MSTLLTVGLTEQDYVPSTVGPIRCVISDPRAQCCMHRCGAYDQSGMRSDGRLRAHDGRRVQ
jgi:hypothetical protein